MMRSNVLAAAAFGFLCCGQLSFAQDPLPPGEGRDIVAVACTQCHGLAVVNSIRQAENAWRVQVYDMILRGAQIHPDDLPVVIDYLSRNFGPGVNVRQSKMAVTLPNGDGSELIETGCGELCHGLDRVVLSRRRPAEWNAIVKRMVFLGAPIGDKEVAKVAAYLSKAFGAQ
jgi:hypothetical protein